MLQSLLAFLTLPTLITLAGVGQLCILIASSLVPLRLNWKRELNVLPRLHLQLYWVYGGYVVLSIVALGLLSIFNAGEIARGGGLARGVCAYVAAFWGIRVALQGFLDVKEHLTTWWLTAGYHLLTVVFLCLTIFYGWLALRPGGAGG